MNLRPYQSAALDAIFDHYYHHEGAPLVVLPTGSGKSLVIAEFCRRVLAAQPRVHLLVLAHVKELVTQNHAELKTLWPQARAGIYSASAKRKDLFSHGHNIIFANIQSIANVASRLPRIDIVIIDEAHRIPRATGTQYARFLADMKRANPNIAMLGLTATPYRLDSGLLHEGADAIFSRICYEANVGDLVAAGYLCPVVPKRTELEVDLSKVGHRGGEFIAGQMQEAFNTSENNRRAMAEILAHGETRKSWLVFCSGVEHAHEMAKLSQLSGVESAAVTGETQDRDEIIRDFKAGRIRALYNCDVLTTGFNAPAIDMIAFLRATESTSLYVQMVGRGMRNAPGKVDCLVLDFARNVMRHGPIDAVRPHKPKPAGKAEPGEAPAKICPTCATIVAIATRRCSCGYEFPEPEKEGKLSERADTLPLLSTEAVDVPVAYVVATPYNKPGKIPTLRVDYLTAGQTYSEWVCVEHGAETFMNKQAHRWWARAGLPGSPPPNAQAAAEAIRAAMWCPASIKVARREQYWTVVAFGGVGHV